MTTPKKQIIDDILFAKRFKQINLEPEIYPNDRIPRQFLLLTPVEIKKLNKATDRRIKLFDIKYRPKGYATYE